MTEDEITFIAQQEPQSELESDDDDDDEEPEPMSSMKAVLQCIETTLKLAESYENSIRFDVMCFSYSTVIYDGPHILCYSKAPLYMYFVYINSRLHPLSCFMAYTVF